MYRLPKTFIAILLLFAIFSISTISTSPPTVDPIGPFLNDLLPKSTPGSAGAWTLEDAMPNIDINDPLQIANIPESEDFFLITKLGEIYKVSLTNQTKQLVLDIKDQTFTVADAGLTGIVLHPLFGDDSAPDKQQVFIYYHTKPNASEWAIEGFNRLSKFAWDDQSQTFDKFSEEILIQQFDRDYLHNGGRMFFGSDDFLYLSVGDEGGRDKDKVIMLQESSTQKIDNVFFSGILRIDVDNNPSRSHPIRRQPIGNAAAPSGWGDTYSQGYSIPNDNPWLSPDSTRLEEFYAIGFRSPYSMHYDEEQDQIWVGDVGSDVREEINQVGMADNLQWPYMEGSVPSSYHEKPVDFIGNEKSVFYEIDQGDGKCILGAGIYRGGKFPELDGKYIYADYRDNKIVALTNIQGATEPTTEAMLNELRGQSVELPEEFAITGIHLQPDGEIIVLITGTGSEALQSSGKLLRLKSKEFVPDPAAKLSELGVFSDLENLIPIDGIIPYKVNAPLWSDGAIKKRWMAIPNYGSFDTDEEKVKFASNDEWVFPKGTVFIKHFELPKNADPDGDVIRLETRFFVIGEDNIGYGLTYKWNEEGTDATLIGGGGDTEHFDIYDENNNLFTQTWNYPGRDQCMACHNQNADYVLGVNTHQLNGSLFYPNTGTTHNQLEYLNEIGLFNKNLGDVDKYPRSVAIDDETADLETRVRSYLDSNCASCHRVGGLAELTLDLRYLIPLRFTSMINHAPKSDASNQNGLIVKPGDHAASELWIRDASEESKRMPPIGRNIVDEVYIEVLTEWIDNLPEDAGSINDLYLHPNPTSGWLYANVHEEWTGPFQVIINIIMSLDKA